MVNASPSPDGAHTPAPVLPTGEPVLVTMPGSPWAGFVGTIDYYLADDMVVVRIQSERTDGPPSATVPVKWVRSLAEVLGIHL